MCMVLHVPELHVLAVRPPRLAWLKSGIATALKPPHEAGGRGGESTARSINDHCIILLAYESSHEMLSLRFRRVLSLR